MRALDDILIQTKDCYESAYQKYGENSQRRYPNEELVRFLARTYQNVPKSERSKIKVLEVGCGSCGNLWMIAQEGFSAVGLDLSPSALKIGKQVLQRWQVNAELLEGSMENIPFEDTSFDSVVDIVASFSLLSKNFENYLREIKRVLKPGGKFFLFTLSTGSDAFKNFAPAIKLEPNTLNGIYRKDSPYYGCFYPHRFYEINELSRLLKSNGLEVTRKELLTRTYRNLEEVFEFISIEATKS
jgi:ubiquinone/menaquinone biosynthesis C-methylase UbiE